RRRGSGPALRCQPAYCRPVGEREIVGGHRLPGAADGPQVPVLRHRPGGGLRELRGGGGFGERLVGAVPGRGRPAAGRPRWLRRPGRNAVVNLLGLPLADRPASFLALLPRLQELRATSGRPHWIVIDEAHHLLPTPWQPGDLVLSPELEGVVLITVHPEHVA